MKRRDDRDEEVKPIARQIEQLARAPQYVPRGYRIGDYGNHTARRSERVVVIERPPGVPFQKIQFGNERGGRSVLSRLPELRIARILALLRCLILRLSVCLSVRHKEICLLGKNPQN